MRSVMCPCGRQSKIADNASVSEQQATTDFRPYMDQSNGLTMMWICSDCDLIVTRALADIVNVFGPEKARYIYLSNKMPKPERTT